MKRLMLAMFAATAVASSTGCCCLEKIFCCCEKPWGCCDPCGGCCDTGCDSCGGCDTCGGGGCDTCSTGGHGGHGGGCSDGSCGLAHGGHGGGCGCGHNGIVAMPGTRNGAGMGPGGPPSAAVTYPYYTNRGPRDFLAKNPPSIGP